MGSLRDFAFIILIMGVMVHCQELKKQKYQKIGIKMKDSNMIGNIFGNMKNKFYVDLGAYDPIYKSKTLDLYLKGWNGINLQPHPCRYSRFITMRPYQINLNLAISDVSNFEIMYNYDSSPQKSTTFPTEKQRRQATDSFNVPALSIWELCARYFVQKPVLINIGPKINLAQMFETYNWNNLKCTPDVFVFETPEVQGVTDARTLGSFVRITDILTKKGYNKLSIQWDGVQVYVVSVLASQYRANFINHQKMQTLTKMLSLQLLLAEVAVASRRRVFADPFTDTANLLLMKESQPLSPNISQLSNNILQYYPNKLTKLNQQPLNIILNFDLLTNSIVLENCSFSITKTSTLNIDMLHLIVYANTTKQEFYIVLDSRGLEIAPRVLVTKEICRESPAGDGRFVSAGPYPQKYGQQHSTQAYTLNYYMLQVVIIVIFVVFFVCFCTIGLRYFCKSLRNQIQLQEIRLNQRRTSSSLGNLEQSTLQEN